MTDYLATADVWTVLDLIVAEFTSDPLSVQCFDLRLVARAKELNRTRPPHPTLDPVTAAAPELLAACLESYAWIVFHGDNLPASAIKLSTLLRAAIAKAEGR